MTAPGYSGKALSVKLGIKPAHLVALDNPPEGFVVEGVPDGARLSRGPGNSAYDVILAFCPDRARLTKRLPAVRRLANRQRSVTPR